MAYVYTYLVNRPINLDGVNYQQGDTFTTQKDLTNHIFYQLGYLKLIDKKELANKTTKKSTKKAKSKKLDNYETKVIKGENK